MFGSAFANKPVLSPEQIIFSEVQRPDRSEYLGAKMGQGWDESLPGRIGEELAVSNREQQYGQRDNSYLELPDGEGDAWDAIDITDGAGGLQINTTHAYAMTEDEWKNSRHYREGMSYRNDMTPARAEVMAEYYDERRYREAIIAAGDKYYGLGMKALGFGATMLGGLPDPVNLVSFGSGAWIGAATTGVRQLAGMGMKQAVMQGVKKGALVGAAENVIGTSLENLYIYPDLNSRGEDMGFADYMTDIAMSAVFGGLLGSAGGALGSWHSKRQADAQQRTIDRAREIADRLQAEAEADARWRDSQEQRLNDAMAPEHDRQHLTLDNDFLWRAGDATDAQPTAGRMTDFADVPDADYLAGFGVDAPRARDLPDRIFTDTTPEGDVVPVRRRRDFSWEAQAGEWRQAMIDSDFTPEQADANVRILGAVAELQAEMHGIDPREWIARQLQVSSVADGTALRAAQEQFFGGNQQPQLQITSEQIGNFINEASANIGEVGRTVLDLMRNNGLADVDRLAELPGIAAEVRRLADAVANMDANRSLADLMGDIVLNVDQRNLLTGMEALGLDVPSVQAALRDIAPVFDDVMARIDAARSGVHPDTLFMTAILDRNDSRINWRNGTHIVNVKGVNIPLLPEGSRNHAVSKLKELQGRWIDDARVGRVLIAKDGVGECIKSRSVEAYSTFEYTAEIIRNAEWFRREPNISEGHGEIVQAVTPLKIGRGEWVAITTFKTKKTKKDGEYLGYYGHRVIQIKKEASGLFAPVTKGQQQTADASTGANLYSILEKVKTAADRLARNEKSSRFPDDITTLYQTAYHGTPYSFDNFTLDNIGGGEGHQAHGWGLYFAQNRGVSEEYRSRLGGRIMLDGKPFYDARTDKVTGTTGNSDVDDLLLSKMGDLDEAIKAAEKDVQEFGTQEDHDTLAALQDIKANNRLSVENDGQLFEVDIPENDMLLDEQKTFEEQPVRVRYALRKAAAEFGFEIEIRQPRMEYSKDLDAYYFVDPYYNVELDNFPRFKDKRMAEAWQQDNTEKYTGEIIYNKLADKLGSQKAASEWLNKHGVKGITYEGMFDGRCFVVFDDKAVDILNTFYQRQADAEARGAYNRRADGAALISLFQNKADLSTIIHEGAGHHFLENIREAAQSDTAPDWVKQGWRDIAEAIGADVDPASPIATAAHEKFAKMAEDYIGKAMAPKGAEPLLKRFVQWMVDIYKAIRGTKDADSIAPGVRAVFDRLLAKEREIRGRHSALDNETIRTSRSEVGDTMRATTVGRDRRDIMRAMELAIQQLEAGEAVDVSAILRGTGIEERLARNMGRTDTGAQARPDYRTEQPDNIESAPPMERYETDSADADILTPERQAELAQLIRDGRIDPELQQQIGNLQNERERVANHSELGQSIAECVFNAAA